MNSKGKIQLNAPVAEAAFFAGEVHIYGSIAKAYRIKNTFLSLLQQRLAHELEVENKSFVK